MRIGSNNVEVAVMEPEEAAPLPEIMAIQRQTRVPHVVMKYRGLPPFADEGSCARTADFPHMKFSCEWFNPLQTQFLPEVEKDNNVVVSGMTSSGKTTVAEMAISYTLGELRKYQPYTTAGYISPLKALASEKEQDWTNIGHWFYQYNVSILTGDYILTDERKHELMAADIVAMSSEMLGSRIRRNDTEKNLWLSNLRVLIIDEVHLLSSEGRGGNLEVALLKFTQVNPNCRIVFLSATMPNVDELGAWLTKLNGKPTSIVKSDYRPVKLDYHFEPFEWDSAPWAYKVNEARKVNKVFDVLQQYPDDKFIVFVHGKKTGRDIAELLKNRGIPAEFHNADATKAKRDEIETSFKSREQGSLRVLISTSTLAWGINVPARRVIITGLHRGIQLVDALDVTQMCGRSGRVGLDKKGDAHILVRDCENDPEVQEHDIEFCKKVEPVTSKIGTWQAVAFHLVSEIAEKNVKDITSALAWFDRTLANHQRLLGDAEKTHALIVEAFKALLNCGAIKKSKDEKTVEATAIGKIASWFYFSPFDVSSWATNFRDITINDTVPSLKDISWALGNTDTSRATYATKNHDFEISSYLQNFNRPLRGGADRACFVVYCLLTGHSPKSSEYAAAMSSYRMDSDRICSAIMMLNSVGRYFKDSKHPQVFYELPYRIKYGIDKGLELTILPGIGKVTAEQIMSRRVFSCKDLLVAQRSTMPILTGAKWEKVRPVAEEIASIGHIEYLKRKHGSHHKGR